MKITVGYIAKFYKDKNFQGESFIVANNNVTCISTYVDWKKNDGKLQGPTSFTIDEVPVIYDTCFFQGNYSVLDVGKFNLNTMGLPNDSISSVRVPPGYKVTLYEHIDFMGESLVLLSDAMCLSDYWMKRKLNVPWMKQASSIRVEKANADFNN